MNVIDFYIGTDIMNSVIAKSFIENPNMSVNIAELKEKLVAANKKIEFLWFSILILFL